MLGNGREGTNCSPGVTLSDFLPNFGLLYMDQPSLPFHPITTHQSVPPVITTDGYISTYGAFKNPQKQGLTAAPSSGFCHITFFVVTEACFVVEG
jgi:hypothetical protein